MFPDLVAAIQFAVGLVFLGAVLGKLRQPRAYFDGIVAYDIVPEAMAPFAGVFMLLLEAAIALAHLTGFLLVPVLPWSAAIIVALLLLVMRMLTKGRVARCLCFGSAEDTISTLTAWRLVVMLAAEVVLWASATFVPPTIVWRMPLEETIGSLLCAALLLCLSSWLLATSEGLSPKSN